MIRPRTESSPSVKTSALDHELVSAQRGRRSGLPIIIARHSTTLGPALGGCRAWRYQTWTDGLQDAMDLAAAMTLKNAVAGLDHGGGKAVIALDPDDVFDSARRRAAFLDVGDAIELMGGTYISGEDVGTTEHDMAVIAERTSHVIGLPADSGGAGEPAAYTALGVHASILTSVSHTFGASSVEGLRITVSGMGQVGTRLATSLAAAGAHLTVSDLNTARKDAAASIGAAWADADSAHLIPADVFVPAGVGGQLTDSVIDALDARIVVGPANNPLAAPSGADRLAARGILYAPDFIVNAGGVVHLARTLAGDDDEEIEAQIRAIGTVLQDVLSRASADGTTPLRAAEAIAADRLRDARLLQPTTA